jgi:ribosomal protein S18 acetylase RimI-like enzyme
MRRRGRKRRPSAAPEAAAPGDSVPVSLNLRTAGVEDASAVRELTRAAYAKWVAVIGREPTPMGADYARAVREHRIDLAFVEGELAGLIEMIPEDDALLIENVAVAPAFQGRGIGRRLLDHAETVAAWLGKPRIRLYTNRAFAENVALYERAGYRIDREEPYRGGFAVYLSKPLPMFNAAR